VHDGQGLVWLRKCGVELAWISGRGSPATKRRAEELGVEFLRLGCRNKRAALEEIQRELGIDRERTAAMGDDLPDLALRAGSGFFAVPSDARPELREVADHLCRQPGGRGAVREVCELLLRVRGQWQAIRSAASR